MEVANLSVKLSADVENAISGLRKSDAAIQKSGMVAKKESTKIEGFMGKWKMGWIAMSTAAIASLYAIAKSSAVIGAYFSEFGALLGYVFDEIGMAMAPIIYPLLDFLWTLADKFATLSNPIKAFIGALILIFGVIAPLISGLTKLWSWLAPAWLTAKLAAIKAGFLGLSGVAAFAIGAIIGIALGLLGVWVLIKTGIIDALDKIGRKFEGAYPIIMDFIKQIMLIPGIVGIVAIDIVTGRFGQIPKDVKEIFKKWQDANIRMLGRVKRFGIAILIISVYYWEKIGKAIWKPIQSAYNKVQEYVEKIIAAMKSIPVVGAAAGYLSSHIPSFQHGGYVPETGLAILHAGEHVTPAGGTTRTSSATTINYSPTFYITGEMRSNTDLRELADRLSTIMKDDVRRIIR